MDFRNSNRQSCRPEPELSSSKSSPYIFLIDTKLRAPRTAPGAVTRASTRQTYRVELCLNSLKSAACLFLPVKTQHTLSARIICQRPAAKLDSPKSNLKFPISACASPQARSPHRITSWGGIICD